MTADPVTEVLAMIEELTRTFERDEEALGQAAQRLTKPSRADLEAMRDLQRPVTPEAFLLARLHRAAVAVEAVDEVGGRAQGATLIRFTLPPEVNVADLPTGGRVDEGRVVIETEDPTGTLHALTGWAIARGVPLGQLTVARRSLEDVYLELVGQ